MKRVFFKSGQLTSFSRGESIVKENNLKNKQKINTATSCVTFTGTRVTHMSAQMCVRIISLFPRPSMYLVVDNSWANHPLLGGLMPLLSSMVHTRLVKRISLLLLFPQLFLTNLGGIIGPSSVNSKVSRHSFQGSVAISLLHIFACLQLFHTFLHPFTLKTVFCCPWKRAPSDSFHINYMCGRYKRYASCFVFDLELSRYSSSWSNIRSTRSSVQLPVTSALNAQPNLILRHT